MIYRLLNIGLLLFAFTFAAYTQTREEKTAAIINQWDLVNIRKLNYKHQLEPLKYQAKGNDSARIIELEKQLSEDGITKRINSAFFKTFSDEEITVIYEFIRTSAFEKFFKSREIYTVILSEFKDIDEEIRLITESIGKPFEPPVEKFKPVPVDKEDGFYATVDYTGATSDKDIKLEDIPSLTLKDIQEVKRIYNNNTNRPEISIEMTKEGAGKFYLFTKKNTGKHIAVVIARQIVSVPKVNSAISDGKAVISGDFTDEEIDKMIEILNKK